VKLAVLGLSVVAAAGQTVNVYSELARITPAGVVEGHPREILSPALVRNGFTSFQIVVRAPVGGPWSLYIGENPEGVLKPAVYRRVGERLEPATLPVDGNGVAVFWMDLWTPAEAPVRRIKIEPQLWYGGEWITYPMEVRVMSATVPKTPLPSASLAGHLCGTARDFNGLSKRNSQQDLLLAGAIAKPELLKIGGEKFCESLPGEAYFRVRDHLFRIP
jgi:hypothetical protein